MSLQANELRIGNWIEAVADMGNYQMKMTEHNFTSVARNPNCVNPIPLTPEILEKCGFTKDGDFMSIDIGNNTIINCLGNGCWVDKIVNECEYSVGLGGADYLHQLQNLYFALTGKELEYKQ
jgi:hypothetical protein